MGGSTFDRWSNYGGFVVIPTEAALPPDIQNLRPAKTGQFEYSYFPDVRAEPSWFVMSDPARDMSRPVLVALHREWMDGQDFTQVAERPRWSGRGKPRERVPAKVFHLGRALDAALEPMDRIAREFGKPEIEWTSEDQFAAIVTITDGVGKRYYASGPLVGNSGRNQISIGLPADIDGIVLPTGQTLNIFFDVYQNAASGHEFFGRLSTVLGPNTLHPGTTAGWAIRGLFRSGGMLGSLHPTRWPKSIDARIVDFCKVAGSFTQDTSAWVREADPDEVPHSTVDEAIRDLRGDYGDGTCPPERGVEIVNKAFGPVASPLSEFLQFSWDSVVEACGGDELQAALVAARLRVEKVTQQSREPEHQHDRTMARDFAVGLKVLAHYTDRQVVVRSQSLRNSDVYRLKRIAHLLRRFLTRDADSSKPTVAPSPTMRNIQAVALIRHCPWALAFFETADSVGLSFTRAAQELRVFHPGLVLAEQYSTYGKANRLQKKSVQGGSAFRLPDSQDVSELDFMQMSWQLRHGDLDEQGRAKDYFYDLGRRVAEADPKTSLQVDIEGAVELLVEEDADDVLHTLTVVASEVGDDEGAWRVLVTNASEGAMGHVRIGGSVETLWPRENRLYGQYVAGKSPSAFHEVETNACAVTVGVGAGGDIPLRLPRRAEEAPPPRVEGSNGEISPEMFVGRGDILSQITDLVAGDHGLEPQPVLLRGNRRVGKSTLARVAIRNGMDQGRLLGTDAKKVLFVDISSKIIGEAGIKEASKDLAKSIARWCESNIPELKGMDAHREQEKNYFTSLVHVFDWVDDYLDTRTTVPLGMVLDEFDGLMRLVGTADFDSVISLGKRRWQNVSFVATTQRWSYGYAPKEWAVFRVPGILTFDDLLQYFAPYSSGAATDLSMPLDPLGRIVLTPAALVELWRATDGRPYLWAQVHKFLARRRGQSRIADVPEVVQAIDAVAADDAFLAEFRNSDRRSLQSILTAGSDASLAGSRSGINSLVEDTISVEEADALMLFVDKTSVAKSRIEPEVLAHLIDRELVHVGPDDQAVLRGSIWLKALTG